MSIYDTFRALRAELFDAFEAPNAVIVRSTSAPRTAADRAAGKVSVSITNTPCRAILGKRKVRNQDGTYRQDTIARVDTAMIPGDKIVFGGSRTFTADAVDEVNPDGTGAIIFVATLK